MADEKSFAETYEMRSRFFRLLGEAGRLLADAYSNADLENQANIKQMAFDAMKHSLVEHHGYAKDKIAP